MAWGVYTFNIEGRQRVAVMLRALLIAQLIVSLCMVIYVYNTSVRVLLLLKHIHKVTVIVLYAIIFMQAYCMKMHYTSGLRLMTWFLRGPHWSRLSWVSGLWMLTGTFVSINGILVYAACRATLKALMLELASSLRAGISQYLTEPNWKHLLDTMQVELSCCGSEKPSDWHEIPWINMDYLNDQSPLVMTWYYRLAGTDAKVLAPVSPYSCCTPHVLAACYHDPLQQCEWREVWSQGSPLLSASLHTLGCVEAVRAPLARSLYALQTFSLIVLLFQVFIVGLTQLLRSSSANAVLCGDRDGFGRAYVFANTHITTAQDIQPRPNTCPGPCASGYEVRRAAGAGLRRGPPRRAARALHQYHSYPHLS